MKLCSFFQVPVVFEGIAWLSFEDLCSRPLGATDYLSLAEAFHTVFISDIPRLDLNKQRNEMRRFITLIDILYESHTRVVCSADAPLTELYVVEKPEASSPVVAEMGAGKRGRHGHIPMSGEEEHFAFDRTVSRLLEMQSAAYLERHKEILLAKQLGQN